MSYFCWKCKNELNIDSAISRSDVCPSCKADIHSCKNCKYYDIGSHYDCHESIEDSVNDKEKANFCDYFKIKDTSLSSKNSNQSNKPNKAEAARNAFNNLFSD